MFCEAGDHTFTFDSNQRRLTACGKVSFRAVREDIRKVGKDHAKPMLLSACFLLTYNI